MKRKNERDKNTGTEAEIEVNKYLSIISLIVNRLNAQIKRHRIAEWIRNHNPTICCLQETHLKTKYLDRLKVKGWKKIYSKQMDKKKSQGSILISDKIHFKTKTIKRDREGHFIVLKGRIYQEDINIVNISAPNIGAPKYIRKILEHFKKDIHSTTLIIGGFILHCTQ